MRRGRELTSFIQSLTGRDAEDSTGESESSSPKHDRFEPSEKVADRESWRDPKLPVRLLPFTLELLLLLTSTLSAL